MRAAGELDPIHRGEPKPLSVRRLPGAARRYHGAETAGPVESQARRLREVRERTPSPGIAMLEWQ